MSTPGKDENAAGDPTGKSITTTVAVEIGSKRDWGA